MKFRSKILLCFLCAILVPSFLTVAIMYVGSVNIIKSKVDELVQKNLDSVRLVIQQRLEFVNELTTFISMNPLIQEVLATAPTEDIDTNVTEILTLDHALDSYYISNYYASTSSPVVPVIHLINKPAYRKYDISNKVCDIADITGKSWYPQATAKNTTIILDESSVIVTRKLYNLRNADTAEYAALLTISLERSFFTQLLNTYKSTPDTKVLLLSSSQEIIASTDLLSRTELETMQALDLSGRSQHRRFEEASLMVSVAQLTNADWSVVSITDLQEINQSQNSLTQIVVALLLLCAVAALFTALLLSRNLSRPITALVQSMDSIRDGNFQPDISYTKKDEFGTLVTQYKQMMSKIEDLINELRISEAKKQHAELEAKDMQLKALQAQINPHFLYNTLDSINLYAIKYDVPKISQMISALADFFRYSLSRGGDIITLGEEVQHTLSYLELQQIRYGPKLSYSFQIPSELRAVRMVKLVLQPLVENSVLHGMTSGTGQLVISVSASCENNQIVILVKDNGIGADTTILNEVLAGGRSRSSGSFAITNVHQRLQNVYGVAYGLHYLSSEGGGLTVQICIPADQGQLKQGGTL